MFKSGTRRFGITLRIALLAWLITVVTITVFVTVSIPEQNRTFLDALTTKAANVVTATRVAATAPVVTEDYGALVEHCLQIVRSDKAITYLVVTKNSGDSWLFDKSGWRFRPLPPEWHPAVRVSGGEVGQVPLFNQRVFHYAHPFDYSGVQWGWIHVGLSLQNYDHNIAAVYRRTGLLALSCILLSLLASGLYARFLVKPILTLQSVVQEVARGDLSARAVITSGDEVELLAESFNAMTNRLLQRDRILGGVQFASQQFLAAPYWGAAALEILTRIGHAAEISRACLFENITTEDGRLVAQKLFEYAASADMRLIHTPQQKKWPWQGAGLETWANCLAQGRVFSAVTGDLSPVEKEFLAPQKIQSVILVPILVEGVWWGHLSFDDCRSQRVWTDAEIDSLRALAHMLGATIARQRAQDALLEAKQTLEQRVSDRTQELQKQVAAKEKALAELAATQQNLIVASRTAGMAEVATGVLHNVGNVLNSVTVSASLLREQLEKSRVKNFVKGANLLREHAEDPVTFLTSDPQGKQLLNFFLLLGEHLPAEQAAWKEELTGLCRNIEHIKQVVSMQQSYARVSGVAETLEAQILVEDALRMNDRALEKHQVQVVRDFQAAPPVEADKHKVLQILVNLVRNAWHAMETDGHRGNTLTISILAPDPGRVQIRVRDEGIGIPPENLTLIFQHGFTTKKNGHGFGLHSSANAAKEMKGSLRASSEGIGTGATFILELPAAPVDRSAPNGRPVLN